MSLILSIFVVDLIMDAIKKRKTNSKKVIKGMPKSEKVDLNFDSDSSDDEYCPSKDEISNQLPSEEESDGESEDNIESENESSKIRPGRERGKSQISHIDPYSTSDVSVFDYCAPQPNEEDVKQNKTKTEIARKAVTKKIVQVNSDDSDASDGDYCPDGEDGNLPSEIDSDGDDEDNIAGDSDDEKSRKKRSTNKRGKRQINGRRKSRKVEVEEEPEVIEAPINTFTEEEEKKRADDLWASFLGDTETPPTTTKIDQKITKENNEKPVEPIMEKPAKEKVTVTEIFEFAGEEVKVTKEVLVDSVESRLGSSSKVLDSSPAPQKKGKFPFVGTPRPSGGGIGAVLGQLGKKNKIGTLEKSKLDWNSFKSQEGIDEEIQTHNKGKDG